MISARNQTIAAAELLIVQQGGSPGAADGAVMVVTKNRGPQPDGDTRDRISQQFQKSEKDPGGDPHRRRQPTFVRQRQRRSPAR